MSPFHRWKTTLVIIATLVFMLGCSVSLPFNLSLSTDATPGPTSPPPPTATFAIRPTSISSMLVNGWSRYSNPAEGYTIDLPSTWKMIDLTGDTIEQIITALKGTNVENMSSQVRDLWSKGAKFMAMDTSPESMSSGFGTNMNLLQQQMNVELPLDSVMKANISQIEGMSIVDKPVQSSVVALPAGQAGKIIWKYNITLQTGKPIKVAIATYVFVRGKALWVLTGGSLDAISTTNLPLIEKITESLVIN